MAKRRRFTPEFKGEVALEALRGETSQIGILSALQCCRPSSSGSSKSENIATLFDASVEQSVQLAQLENG